MKYYTSALLLSISFLFNNCKYQTTEPKPIIVIVHGAWGGGWAFQHVDSVLSFEGYKVYRPTLTGQGERTHLASADIGLYTHIQDVVNTILYEKLNDIILVGHSYGGMVVTGVADSIPQRIKKLIYLDAFIPEDSESVLSIQKKYNKRELPETNGFIIPPWVAKDKLPPKDVPHAYKTFTDIIHLKNKQRLQIPTSYILTVDKGVQPQYDRFAEHAERAKEKEWPVMILEADHNPQWSNPQKLTELLIKIIND